MNINKQVQLLPVEIQRIINEYARNDKNCFLVNIINTLYNRFDITNNILKPITNKHLFILCIDTQRWLLTMMNGVGEKKQISKETFFRRGFGGGYEERKYRDVAAYYNINNQVIDKFFINTKKRNTVKFSKVLNRLYKKYLDNFKKNIDVNKNEVNNNEVFTFC